MTTVLEMFEIHLRNGQKIFRDSTVKALVHECQNLKMAAGDSELQARALSITGHTSDIDEALDEFENVKQAVTELFDENQALSTLNRRLILTLSYANQAMDIVERDAQMFITPKARKWIEKFREQYTKLDIDSARAWPGVSKSPGAGAGESRLHSKLFTKKENQHAKPNP